MSLPKAKTTGGDLVIKELAKHPSFSSYDTTWLSNASDAQLVAFLQSEANRVPTNGIRVTFNMLDGKIQPDR
jgi:hypothetical protein